MKFSPQKNYFILINSAFAFFLLTIFAGLVQYTPDWSGYVYWYENDAGRDFLFSTLARVFLENDLDYGYLHFSFVFIYSLLFLLLVVNLADKDIFLLVVFYFSVNYLFYTTQIRFALAYFSICLSLLFYFRSGINWKSMSFFFLAVLSHTSSLAMIFMYFIIKPKGIRLKKTFLMIGGFWFSSFLFFDYLIQYFDDYSYLVDYVNSGASNSTVLGGFFVFFPYLMSSFFIYLFYYSTLLKCVDDKAYNSFLWSSRMAIGSMFFFPFALSYQIIGHRFIVFALIFHLISWRQIISVSFSDISFRYVLLIFIWLLFFIYTYYVPYLFGLESLFEKTFLTFESNVLI